MPEPTADLHTGFGDPRRAPAEALVGFLEEADRLPGMRSIHRAMRAALDLRPGARVLDAGCGVGLEAARLADEHPHAHVTGLDRNGEMLQMARRRTGALANLDWIEADLADLALDACFDAVRTERVLMYLPDPALDRALDDLVGLLAPGGRMVHFELDYGATLLPQAGHDDAVVRRAGALLERSLPQPWAGRVLPELLAERGLDGVGAAPYSFAVSEPVWRRIVHDTLTGALEREPDPKLAAWLADVQRATAGGGLLAAFTGVLTTARTG
jgi:SAM-dependent methyltransferase